MGEIYVFSHLKLNRYLTSEVTPYFPVCLPPRKSWADKFIGDKVKLAGYGRTVSKKIEGEDKTACKLQVACSSIVKPHHDSCKKVNMKYMHSKYTHT